MLTNGHTPLHTFLGPLAANLQQPLRQTDARCRDREPAGIQRRERDLQSLSFLRDHVFAWHPHVGELYDPVIERAQAHETTAVCDLEPGRIDIDDKCSD